MAITSQIGQLLELKQLYEQGILTKEEMEIEKQKILDTNNSYHQNYERQTIHSSTNELNRLYQVAHRAKDSDNYEEAAKYYRMIHQEDPNSWEACFYSLYFATMDKDIIDFAYEASKINDNTQSVLKLLKDSTTDEEVLNSCLTEITNRLIKIGELFFDVAVENYNLHSKTKNAANKRADDVIAAGQIGYTLGDTIVNLFGKNRFDELVVKAWSHGINCNIRCSSFLFWKVSGNYYSTQNQIANSYRDKMNFLKPYTKNGTKLVKSISNKKRKAKIKNARMKKYLFPVSFIVIFVIGIIIFHENYVYTDYWIEEEIIIACAIGVLAIILLAYYLITKRINKKNNG
ncbi:MAG: SHOCT domain-containing protein [Prevotella sp.]|nr:SHOCT domain-containing protein [Prevotella sp.]